MSMTKAFSLVELSIVLVILGLLTGGILSGQSLIRAAELRSVTTDFQRYQAAFHTFQDRYREIPGDMRNATRFWGKDVAACNGDTGNAGTPGTCNGNGDGSIGSASGANSTGERFQIWKQLALAGLIEGTYTGLSGTSGTAAIMGTNVPSGRLSNSLFEVSSCCDGGGASFSSAGTGRTMTFGGAGWAAILTAQEAWNIDSKLDDGKPARGRLIARHWSTCTNATGWTDLSAEYLLTATSKVCSLHFLLF